MNASQKCRGWGVWCAISLGLSWCLLAPLAVMAQDAPATERASGGGEEFILKTYPVPAGTAEAVAKTLQEAYKDSPKVRIMALTSDKIVIYAGPEDHRQIGKIIGCAAGVELREAGKSDPPPAVSVTEVMLLKTLDAVKVADSLKAMFGNPKNGGPFIEIAPDRNTLIVRGSAEQISEIKSVLHNRLEERPQGANTRLFTVEKGSAAAVAEAMKNLLTQMRSNPVKVVLPASSGGSSRTDPPKKPDPEKKEAKPGKPEMPITLTAFGNRLVVTSDDPEALALAAELFRLLQAPAAEGDFEVIQLKNARAEEAARILDETFNGPRPDKGPARPERIRVVADPTTNSLIIRASALDLHVIRRLLEPIDGPVEAQPVVRTWVIGPLKHAMAKEVAPLIKQLYREGEIRMAVDERSNSVVLRCSEPMYIEVKKLIDVLEQFARETPPKEKEKPDKK